jgi:hypothetical protein
MNYDEILNYFTTNLIKNIKKLNYFDGSSRRPWGFGENSPKGGE